jgi:hypothetical protein
MKRTRLLLVGAMLTLLAVTSWTPASARSCLTMCLQSYYTCISSCRNNGTCRTICGDALTICEQGCSS